MKKLFALALLVLVPGIVFAEPKPATLVGSASYQDLDKTKSGIASFDLTFPLGSHFALGPVVSYTYAKVEAADAETALTVVPGAGSTPTPAPAATTAPTDSLSILSYGLRAALYVQKSHNGVGFSLEGLAPVHDAEGYLLTPGLFFEAAAGSKGIFRAEYQHPFHYSEGESIDLEGWRVSAGFGRRW